MMTEAQLNDILNNPARLEHLNMHELRSLQLQYPYASVFYVLAAIRQKMNTGEVDSKTLAKAAAFAPDRVRLMQLINQTTITDAGKLTDTIEFKDTPSAGADELSNSTTDISETPTEDIIHQETHTEWPLDQGRSQKPLEQTESWSETAQKWTEEDELPLPDKFPEDPHAEEFAHEEDAELPLPEKFPEDPHAEEILHNEDAEAGDKQPSELPWLEGEDIEEMPAKPHAGEGETEEQTVIPAEEKEEKKEEAYPHDKTVISAFEEPVEANAEDAELPLPDKFPEDPHAEEFAHEEDAELPLPEKFPEDPHAEEILHNEDAEAGDKQPSEDPWLEGEDIEEMPAKPHAGEGETEEQTVIPTAEKEEKKEETYPHDKAVISSFEEPVEANVEDAGLPPDETRAPAEDIAEPEDASDTMLEKPDERADTPVRPLSFADFLSLSKPVDLLLTLPPEDIVAGKVTSKKAKKGIPGIPGSFEPDPIRARTIEKHRDIASETLAQILVIQEKYEEALEMYKILQLKIPKKSTYFALQIRELEKKLNSGSQINN